MIQESKSSSWWRRSVDGARAADGNDVVSAACAAPEDAQRSRLLLRRFDGATSLVGSDTHAEAPRLSARSDGARGAAEREGGGSGVRAGGGSGGAHGKATLGLARDAGGGGEEPGRRGEASATSGAAV